MNAVDLLLHLVEVGAVLWLDGERLRFRAPLGAVSKETRAHAAACRPALRALLAAGAVLPRGRDGWPAEQVEEFEERAAIMEFDGGLARAEAERAAEHVVRQAFTIAFLERAAMFGRKVAAAPLHPDVVKPAAAAVAPARPGSDPHRRP